MERKRSIHKTWRAVPVDQGLSATFVRELSCSPIVADLLVGRGLSTSEEAEHFLNPKLAHLRDPFRLPQMEQAVARVSEAVRRQDSIAVFGDYDVDGMASTALLLDFFRFLGVPARSYLPHRLNEGYGLSAEHARCLARDGVKLIIAVDNGSTAVDAVEQARSLGMEVVVVDHHLPSDVVPRAAAVVNPWLPGAEYPFPYLAGVGVTFKFVWAMCQHFSRSRKVSREFRDFMVESLGLVGLGTIADVVPLRDENRVLVHYGLKALEASRRPGLRALVELAAGGAKGRGRPLDAEDVAFRMAPCLNAAGRLGEADVALELLVTRDPSKARELLPRLVRENDHRRAIERQIYLDARERILREVNLEEERFLVLAREGWHPGVIGIVASRLVEDFFRPTLLISLEGEHGKGSGRSIPQVSISDALQRAKGCLEGFGGHARAAGVQVAANRIDDLRRVLNKAVELSPQDMIPQIDIDGEYSLSRLTPELLREIAKLSPFGEGNREPRFAIRDVEVVGVPRLMGKKSDHLSFFVRENNTALRAIAFGMAQYHKDLSHSKSRVSVAYQPKLNTWGNAETVELQVQTVDFTAP